MCGLGGGRKGLTPLQWIVKSRSSRTRNCNYRYGRAISLLIEYGAGDSDMLETGLGSLPSFCEDIFYTNFLQQCLDARQKRIFDLSDFLLTCTDLDLAIRIAVAEFIHGDPTIKPNPNPNKRYYSELFASTPNKSEFNFLDYS